MRLCEKTRHIQIWDDGSQIRLRKTGARVNSHRKEFVNWKSSVRGGTNPTHRSTSLQGGTEDVTSLKRTTVETLAIPLKISAPSLKISSEWNL